MSAWAAAGTALAAEPIPIRLGGAVTIRGDDTRLEDPSDLLSGDNRLAGLRGRIRLSVESDDPQSLVGGGLRFSTGETANPASPFIRLGDAFRAQSFGLDRLYLVVRPFRRRDAAVLSVGKMPLPFWRGDRGSFRTEMIWDDDISPVGISMQNTLRDSGEAGVKVVNTLGYFVVQEVQDDRLAGFTGDTYLLAEQVHVRCGRLSAAAVYYGYVHLNAGLRPPSVEGGTALSGTSALLLRPPLQVTNRLVGHGPGARGFVRDSFGIVDVTAQAHAPLPWLKSTGNPEVFLLGQLTRNFRAPAARHAYGVTAGLRGGGWNAERLHPYGAHLTWRDVDEDAAIGAFADSDLGGGTGFRGFEVGVNYRLARNLLLASFLFKYAGPPAKHNDARRLFLDLTWEF